MDQRIWDVFRTSFRLLAIGLSLWGLRAQLTAEETTDPKPRVPEPGAIERGSSAYMPLPADLPSPSTFKVERKWAAPHFLVWPSIIYSGESRNAVIHIQLPHEIRQASWQWEGAEPITLRLPSSLSERVEQTSALVAIPNALGLHSGHLQLDDQRIDLKLRLVNPRNRPLPHQRLVGGYPVDRDGTPVIVTIPEDKGRGDRRWWVFRRPLPMGTGDPVFLGDPLASLGQTVLPRANDGFQSHLFDEPYPDNAGLVAWAQVASSQPHTVVWSPGNAAIEQGLWREDELRFIDTIKQLAFAQGHSTRCVLLLPPLPVAQRLHEKAQQRRNMLRRHASLHQWIIIDAERLAGDKGRGAALVSDGLFTRYPHGPAQDKLRTRLSEFLRP